MIAKKGFVASHYCGDFLNYIFTYATCCNGWIAETARGKPAQRVEPGLRGFL
jgi:hypothetical protein